MTLFRLLVVHSFAVSTGSVIAQTAAPDPAAPNTQACVRPGHYPGKKASDNRKEAWINDIRVWGDCVKSYVADLRAQVDAKIMLANSTIEDYNAGIKELQEEQKAAEMQGQVGR
jgi:hypothetical protein